MAGAAFGWRQTETEIRRPGSTRATCFVVGGLLPVCGIDQTAHFAAERDVFGQHLFRALKCKFGAADLLLSICNRVKVRVRVHGTTSLCWLELQTRATSPKVYRFRHGWLQPVTRRRGDGITCRAFAGFQMKGGCLRRVHFVGDALTAGKLVQDYIHPDDQQQGSAAIAKAVRTKSVFELEHRVRQVDGSLGWTPSRAIPILDENGDVEEWIGAASDVTARHQARVDLEKVTAASDAQKRFYESLISSTPDLVYAFDREYRFVFANRALLQMWGRKLEDSVGQRLIDVGYEPWHAEMHEREIDQVIATKTDDTWRGRFPACDFGKAHL